MKNTEKVVETVQNPNQDGTIIVPNAELQAITKANQLPEDLASVIQDKFSGAFAQLDEWKAKSDALIITSEDQVVEIALASEGRKTLQKIRTSLEKTRVELKAPYLNMGRAIDAVCKALTERIEPIESDLKMKAEYAANLAQERKAKLIAERKLALNEVGHVGEIQALGEMPEETFQMILDGAAMAAQRKKEQDEREQAQRESLQRLENTINDIKALGAIQGEDSVYRLGNCEFIPVDQGMNLDTLRDIVTIFHNEKLRLAKREQTGRDRREKLLAVQTDRSWELLADLTDQDWDESLAHHTMQFNTKKEKAENLQLRTRALLNLGAKIEETEVILGKAQTSEGELYEADQDEWAEILAAFTSERDRIKSEADALQAKEARYHNRKMQLVALGALLGTDEYYLGNLQVRLSVVNDQDDTEWTATIEQFTNESQRIANEKAEQLRKDRERQIVGHARVNKLREVGTSVHFDDVADLAPAVFETMFLEAEKAHNEAEAMKQRNESRKQSLFALGASWAGKFILGDAIISMVQLESADDKEWATLYQRFVDAKAAKELAEKKAIEDAAILKAKAEQQAIKDQQAKEEAERQKKAASAPDKEKWAAFVNALRALELPSCTTEEGKTLRLVVDVELSKIADRITANIEGM